MKLLELEDSLDQLEASRNPFALVVASHLRGREAGPGSSERLRTKLRLCRQLRDLGLSRDDLDGLFLILDVTMELSPELEEQFEQQIHEWEDTMKLTVPNRWLEKGIEQGLEKGLEQGRREMVQRMLASGLAREQVMEIAGLSSEGLERLLAEPAEER